MAEQDNIITTGGPFSWIDLVIYIVRKYAGNEIAKLTADMAVADSQPLSQQLYAPAGFLNSRHPLLMKAEQLVRYQNPGITVDQLAEALNLTPRTLNRKMTALIQESPKTLSRGFVLKRRRLCWKSLAKRFLRSPTPADIVMRPHSGGLSVVSWACPQGITKSGSKIRPHSLSHAWKHHHDEFFTQL
jgi:hypothetical protein